MAKDRSDPKVQQLLKKLDSLYIEIKSDEHYEATPSLAYGYHDPFEIPIAPCEVCSFKPQVNCVTEAPAPKRWQCICECGRKPKSVRKKTWQAAIEWNWINLNSLNYRDLPLFGLANLDAEQAHQRLVGFRRNLELRKNIAEIEGHIARLTERSIGIEQPGKGYTEKLDAYLMWCMWGLRLTKIEKQLSK